MTTAVTTWRFTVEDYHRMGEAGIFGENDRVELIDGEIVRMVPINAPHTTTVIRLNDLLTSQLRGKALVSVQNPVRLSERSEPQPDFSVLVRKDYIDTPTTADVLFLIEVADTSLEYDRGEKLAFYARAGIPEVWIVDLPDGVIECYSRPIAGSYAEVLRAGRGETIGSISVPDLRLNVDDVLPPRAEAGRK